MEEPQHKKLQLEDQVLIQFLLDLQLTDKCKEHHSQMPKGMPISMVEPPHKDIFRSVMQPVWFKGAVSTTAVFTARLMLDVNTMFGPKMPNLYRQLTFAQRFAAESIAVEITPDGRLKTAELNWPNSEVASITEAQSFLEKLKTPVIPMLKHTMVQMNPPTKLYTYANAPPELRAE